MAKMVGLSRNLKMQWLNKTVELVNEGLTEKEVKESLNEYLSFEIKSETNLRKTREILMNIWVYENAFTDKIKPIALDLIKQYPDYALEIHWCMMLTAYPVFVDMCKFIGKLAEFHDKIILSQLKQKLFDEWGERTTLYHSIDKLVSTLKEFQVLLCDKPGQYHINMHKISNSKIISFMVYVMMQIDNGGYYTFSELNTSKYFFPFEYVVEKEWILEDTRFTLTKFGDEIVVMLSPE